MTSTCEAGSPKVARLGLTLLGDFQARLGSGPPLRLRTRKTKALLAYLGLPAGQAHSRDKVAALLWGELPPAQARGRLRETLFALRRALAPADPLCLEVGSETLALTADAVDVDAVSFERLVQTDDPATLARAVELYSGDLLEGLAFWGGAFEDWLMPERERLRELAVDALAKLLAHQRSTGDADAALRTALRLVALDPLQESVHRTLMRLYAELGRRGAALRQYQLCVGVLQRELSAEPEADTRRLYQDILRRRPSRRPVHGTLGGAGYDRLPPALIATKATPLIGRDREVTQLRQLLRRAGDSIGGFVAIVGEAGVGKTRLITEIASDAARLEVRVLLGRCYESDQILPFGPWVDALRTTGVTADEALLGALTPPWRAELTRLLPEVGVPGLPPPGDNPLRLFESVALVIRELAVQQPVLVILEDLHWADDMTLRLLAFIIRRIPAWRLLFVVTARDEELAETSVTHRTLQELRTEAHAERLPLLPLSRADTGRLIHAVARAGSSPQEVACLTEQVWAVSEGNPFVLIETARALQDGSLPQNARPLALPERVRELLSGHLARLSNPARELASFGAVIGRGFEFDLLQRAAGLEEAAAAVGMEELVRRQILHEVAGGLDFVHERVRRVVYAELLRPRQRLLHRRVAETIQALYSDDLEPHLGTLALHFQTAEMWGEAATCLGRAGQAALRASAYREATALLDRARDALARLSDTRQTMERTIDVLLPLSVSCLMQGQHASALARLREAEKIAGALGDDRYLARVNLHLATVFRSAADYQRGLETSQRAVALSDEIGDEALGLIGRSELGANLYLTGRLRDAASVLQDVAEQSALVSPSDDWMLDRRVLVGFLLALALGELGELGQALAWAQDAAARAAASRVPEREVIADLAQAAVLSLKGEFEEAAALAGRAAATCREWGIMTWSTIAAWQLGMAYLGSGRTAEGVALLRQAREESIALYGAGTPGELSLGSLAALMSGELDAAHDLATRALDANRERGSRGTETKNLLVLGEAARRREPPRLADAERHFLQARVVAEGLGQRPDVARAQLFLGQLYAAVGKHRQARQHLAQAAALFHSMGMNYYFTRAEAALRDLGVSDSV